MLDRALISDVSRPMYGARTIVMMALYALYTA
jgi:hypothetical protein